jgi:hypothetical protein
MLLDFFSKWPPGQLIDCRQGLNGRLRVFNIPKFLNDRWRRARLDDLHAPPVPFTLPGPHHPETVRHEIAIPLASLSYEVALAPCVAVTPNVSAAARSGLR